MVWWVAAVKLNPQNFRVKTVNGFKADRKQIRPEKGKTSFKLKSTDKPWKQLTAVQEITGHTTRESLLHSYWIGSFSANTTHASSSCQEVSRNRQEKRKYEKRVITRKCDEVFSTEPSCSIFYYFHVKGETKAGRHIPNYPYATISVNRYMKRQDSFKGKTFHTVRKSYLHFN